MAELLLSLSIFLQVVRVRSLKNCMLGRNKKQGLGPAFFINKIHLLFFVIVALVLISYSEGLKGPFLFDDFATLPRIGFYGEIKDIRGLFVYLAGDISGTGRPIPLLSFLLNATSWPSDPWWFKATNLLLHLFIGGLVYVFIKKLLIYNFEKNANAVALLVSSYWLLNPMNVSTVLYVVQRMAMLSTMFVLLGLIFYMHGRLMLKAYPRNAYIWMTLGVVLFTTLAFLSKENGALLPMLILVIEFTLLRSVKRGRSLYDDQGSASNYCSIANMLRYLSRRGSFDRPSNAWVGVFLWIPSIFVVGALLFYSLGGAYTSRAFSINERLLTETRVIFEYIWYWFNPFSTPRGVLSDGYVISHGLNEPWTTLPAVLGVFACVGLAIWQRQRDPYIAAAILFFFVAHLMESTIVPLEIYFEHRNYLPSILLVLPVGVWLVTVEAKRVLLMLFVVMTLGAQSYQTHRLAAIWGDELSLAQHWVHRNPQSNRAVDFLASTLSKYGRPDLAVDVLRMGIERWPQNSHFYLHRYVQKCISIGATKSDFDGLMRQFYYNPLEPNSYPLLASLKDLIGGGACLGATGPDLSAVLKVLIDNNRVKQTPGALWPLLHLYGEVLLWEGKLDVAISSFQASLNIHPDIGVGLQQVAALASKGYYEEALTWLGKIEQLPVDGSMLNRLRMSHYSNEIAHLRSNIQGDLLRSTAKNAPQS